MTSAGLLFTECHKRTWIFLRAMLKDPIQSQMKDLAERLQVPASHIQVYKKRLIDAGIIRQVSRGIIRYDVPMLREYLRENCEEP